MNCFTYPNLFVVGAMKAGTSSVHHVLSKHPDIFMSAVKEPKYFAFQGERRQFSGPRDPANKRRYAERDRYLTLFLDRGSKRYAGESSTIYLYMPNAAENIRRTVPDARIIAILRDPVDRAYSNFTYGRQRALEPECSFRRALELEEKRIALNWGPFWHYKRKGFYAEQIERFYAQFPRQQVFIGLYDDLKSDPNTFYRRIFRFLDVSDEVTFDTKTVKNRSFKARSHVVDTLLQIPQLVPSRLRSVLSKSAPGALLRSGVDRLHALNRAAPEPMPPDVGQELHDYYLPHICRLEDLLEIDLEKWRTRSS